MTQKEYSVWKAAGKPSGTAVIRNMADAVSYLCGVASEAGLDNIAARLAGICDSLRKIASSQDETPHNNGGEQVGR
jgi:hypothetical protein